MVWLEKLFSLEKTIIIIKKKEKAGVYFFQFRDNECAL